MQEEDNLGNFSDGTQRVQIHRWVKTTATRPAKAVGPSKWDLALLWGKAGAEGCHE